MVALFPLQFHCLETDGNSLRYASLRCQAKVVTVRQITSPLFPPALAPLRMEPSGNQSRRPWPVKAPLWTTTFSDSRGQTQRRPNAILASHTHDPCPSICPSNVWIPRYSVLTLAAAQACRPGTTTLLIFYRRDVPSICHCSGSRLLGSLSHFPTYPTTRPHPPASRK